MNPYRNSSHTMRPMKPSLDTSSLYVPAASLLLRCWPWSKPGQPHCMQTSHLASLQQIACRVMHVVQHTQGCMVFSKCLAMLWFSWRLCLGRYDNPPHVELLAAATEQMKITELRLQKLVASQEQQTAASVSTIAERRAGLVFNHLMGAHSYPSETRSHVSHSCNAMHHLHYLQSVCLSLMHLARMPVSLALTSCLSVTSVSAGQSSAYL